MQMFTQGEHHVNIKAEIREMLSISQGTPMIVSKRPGARRETWNISFPESHQREHDPVNTLISDF